MRAPSARANPYGLAVACGGLPAQHHLDHVLSTERQRSILVDVHSALPRTS